jgi:hypothetical protein
MRLSHVSMAAHVGLQCTNVCDVVKEPSLLLLFLALLQCTRFLFIDALHTRLPQR